jgi:probable metal-binding protein
MEERHAHDVMEMMISSGKQYSRESLAAAIRERFGEGVTFYTCSASGLDPEELVQFLEMKGKFTGTEEAFAFNPGRMCQGH